MAVISFDRVSKRYGQTNAVRELSLSIERGEMFGLIGPDGAGKTTTIRLMCGLLPPDGVPYGCSTSTPCATIAG